MLDRNEVILHFRSDLLGAAERSIDCARNIILIRLAAGACHARQLLQLLRYGGIEALNRHAHLFEQLRGQSALLP